jgi:hypothetical protein
VPSGQSSDVESNKGQLGEEQAKSNVADAPLVATLATQQGGRTKAVLGDAVLRWLRIRKGPRKEQYDPDAIATQPSIWDSDNVEEYKRLYIHPQWENLEALDPSARWMWRESRAARHKVGMKIMVNCTAAPYLRCYADMSIRCEFALCSQL